MKRLSLEQRKLAKQAMGSYLANGIDTPGKAYFWGAFLTDGTCSAMHKSQTSFSVVEWNQKFVDYQWLQNLASDMHGGMIEYPVTINAQKLNFGRSENWYFRAVLAFHSRDLCSDVVRVSGLKPGQSKTFDLKFPELEESLNPHFVRGVFEGDGCIALQKNGFITSGFTSSNLKFLEDLQKTLEIECFEQKLLTPPIYRDGKPVWDLVFGGRVHLRQFFDWIYPDDLHPQSSMPRKLHRVRLFRDIAHLKYKERIPYIQEFRAQEQRDEQALLDRLVSLSIPLIKQHGTSKSQMNMAEPGFVFTPSFLRYVQEIHMQHTPQSIQS